MQANNNSLGPGWGIQNGSFFVVNGRGDSSGSDIDTRIPCVPGTWYRVDVVANPLTQTFSFYIDGNLYNGQTLHFIGQPTNLGNVNYETSTPIWLDDLHVYQGAVPEPGSFGVLATAGAALLLRRRPRRAA